MKLPPGLENSFKCLQHASRHSGIPRKRGSLPVTSLQGVGIHNVLPEWSGSLGVKYYIFLSLCVFFSPFLIVQDFFLNAGFT